ncbi:LacI family DNA-binding transcriptional regulator [Barrientosiimonas endolithica]|uniref:HTH lacI-type domain-containing protein n=1 Tax=Barrientosiimonas endolithica TaxID=1535208 RepID=A0ABM8H7J0_9MICO|nr:LacI family DNA-binding transcriptional regulator [Barrientosiimonas endolithica]BDZ56827.1 hypothetical protein GCM10025872_04840 [Barrientosiimonas endolithica]
MSVPRIRDVAALAGVAPSTVSVVLNGKATARVSDDTRRRIHEAAEQLGYTPNVAARRLRTTPERAVAVVAEDDLSTLPYGLGLLDGLYRACWEQGCACCCSRPVASRPACATRSTTRPASR